MFNKANAEYELKSAFQTYSKAVGHPSLCTAWQEEKLIQAIDKYIQECIKTYALEVIVATKTENER